MERWTDRPFVPTFHRSIVPSDSVAHPPGRHSPRTPRGSPGESSRHGVVDGAGDRRSFGRRTEAEDVRGAGGSRAPAPGSHSPLSYGRRVSGGPRGGRGARSGLVRLRGADAQWPQRDGVHAGGTAQHSQRGVPHRREAARPDVRLRGLYHVLARIPAAPVRRGRAAGPAAAVVAQRSIPDPPRRGDARGDPRRRAGRVGRRLAPPLHSTGNRMTMLRTLSLLLLTPPGQGGGGLSAFVIQFGLIIAIFYFVLIRPQRRQAEQHKQLLASLQRGDQVVTSSGIVGEVVHIKEDQVTVRSGESKFVILRSGISSITNRGAEEAKPA